MCPRTKAQIQEIRTASKQKIMDAALALFANKGYSATSISDIAKSANVSKGLMYNYFKSKEHLLKEVVQSAVQIGVELLKHPDIQYESPHEEIISIINNSVRHVETHYDYWKSLMVVSFQPDAMLHIKGIVEEHSQWGLIKGTELFTKMKIKNPETHSLLVAAAMDGMFLHYIQMSDHYPLQLVAQKLIDTFVTPYINTKKNK